MRPGAPSRAPATPPHAPSRPRVRARAGAATRRPRAHPDRAGSRPRIKFFPPSTNCPGGGKKTDEIACLLLDRQAGAGPFGERAVEQPRVVARLRERQVAERGARAAAAIRHDFLAMSDTGRRYLTLELLARGQQPILAPVHIPPYQI